MLRQDKDMGVGTPHRPLKTVNFLSPKADLSPSAVQDHAATGGGFESPDVLQAQVS